MTTKAQSAPGQTQPEPRKSLVTIKNATISPVLLLMCIIMIGTALASILTNLQTGRWYVIAILFLAAGWLAAVTFTKNRSYSLRVNSLLAVLYSLSIYDLVFNTPLLDARIILGCFIVIAFIFHSSRQGILAAAISVATVLVSGGIHLAELTRASSTNFAINLSAFISTSLVFSLAALLMAFSLTLFIRKVETGLSQSDSQITDLKKQVTELDSTVLQAGEEYKKNQRSFEITNQFIEQFSLNPSPETVLNRAVEYIRSEFNYYFVAVFEPDEKKEFAVLKAGTGEEGNRLRSLGTNIKLTDVSLISHSYNHAEIRLSHEVLEDIEYLANPALPETKSVLAIPLIVNEKVIGILDIESARLNGFTPEDIKILRHCADQLAIVYDKTLLAKKLEKTQEEIENAYKQFTQKSWKSHLRGSKKKYSYRFIENKIEKEALQPIEILQAINQGEAVIIHSQPAAGSNARYTSLAIPIKLRGQSIGALDIKINLGQVPGDLMPLIETISDRLAVALENARLLEEIQDKAEREHQVGEISNKIRSSPNVEQILRTAVAEIGQSLGAGEVSIQLRSEQ